MSTIHVRRLVGYPEAAAYAGRSVRQLARWAAAGKLSVHEDGPNRVLVDLDDIDKLLRLRAACHLGQDSGSRP